MKTISELYEECIRISNVIDEEYILNKFCSYTHAIFYANINDPRMDPRMYFYPLVNGNIPINFSISQSDTTKKKRVSCFKMNICSPDPNLKKNEIHFEDNLVSSINGCVFIAISYLNNDYIKNVISLNIPYSEFVSTYEMPSKEYKYFEDYIVDLLISKIPDDERLKYEISDEGENNEI